MSLTGNMFALAALLHDIGKLRQRTGLEYKETGLEDLYCPYRSDWNGFTHRHVLHTVAFIDDVKDRNRELYMRFFNDEFTNLAAKHHKPDDENHMQKLIQKADRISSAADREGLEEYRKGMHITEPLRSIFTSVKGIYNTDGTKEYAYRLGKMYPGKGEEIKTNIYPYPYDTPRDKAKAEAEYLALYESLLDEIGKLTDISDDEKLFQQFYGLMENYTTFVPAATNDVKNNISLFDHMKTTAAIAVCLSTEGLDSENPFLVIEGDISGIQKFIYKVAEGEDSKKHVAKNLRGRSFYINALNEFAAHYFISGMNLTLANILYCGGGTFQVLAPNTQRHRKLLEELELKLVKELYKIHHTSISIVISFVEASETDLEKDFSRCIGRLKDKIGLAKHKKYLCLLNGEQDFFRAAETIGVCKACDGQVEKAGDDYCRLCGSLEKIGEEIVRDRIKFIGYGFRKKPEPRGGDIIRLGEAGYIYLAEEPIPIEYLYSLQEPAEGKCNLVFPYARAIPLKTENGQKVVVPFEELCETVNEGDKRLGLLKMDVDNLGLLFAAKEDESFAISRAATLSRFMENFFSCEIERICKEVSAGIIGKEKYPLDEIFYINYAGGDDLFIIGSWQSTIELAREIRKRFKQYTCHNPNISISAGIQMVRSKEPVRNGVHYANDMLEMAKNYKRIINGRMMTKDAITILEQPLDWELASIFDPEKSGWDFDLDDYQPFIHIENVLSVSYQYNKWMEEGKLTSSLLYRLMTRMQGYLEDMLGRTQEIPRLLYMVARNVDHNNENVYRHFKQALMLPHDRQKINVHRLIILASKIALLRIRED